ncbi:hypothetical protein GALL_41360 [mine drainage metagenome]|uniref:Chemotaxis phosphatase CheX-like domain-containing protein n=1 Tax=mine drainage metagenome TaxID=410659 RepID=A0A1J5T2D4_9ZZZZ
MSFDKTRITDDTIQDCLVKGMSSVFQVMLRLDLKFVRRESPESATVPESDSQIIGNVGFGGKINGIVYLAMSEDLARTLACHMLGLQPQELAEHGSDAVTDALGEITNMAVGGFKNTIADMGYPCKLTVPTIVRGQNLTISSIKGATRYVYTFECAGAPITADLHMQEE